MSSCGEPPEYNDDIRCPRCRRWMQDHENYVMNKEGTKAIGCAACMPSAYAKQEKAYIKESLRDGTMTEDVAAWRLAFIGMTLDGFKKELKQ